MKVFTDLYPHDPSLASGLSSLDGRLSALEEWACRPASVDILADTLNVTRAINLQGEDITASRITGMESDIAANASGIAGVSTGLTMHTGSRSNPHAVTKAQVGLGNVEDTALSTWAGTSNITTLGTISSGTWQGSKIANAYLANSSISVNGASVSLGGSVTTGNITAGTAGTSAATSGYSLSVPYVTMDKYGVVTGYGTHTHTVQNIPNASLVNSSMTIAGASVSLGGSVSASTIKSAMRFSALSFSTGAFSSVSSYNTNAAVAVKIPTTTSHISEGSNLYFTDARAVSACAGTYQTVTDTGKAELALASGLASLEGRVAAIEEWLRNISADELLAQVVNIVKTLNLGGIDIHLNSSGVVQIDGDLCATGGISCRA